MKISLEREFKSEISEEKYLELLKEFKLENKSFIQTNHYFDNDSFDLLENHITLRIREKNGNYKITTKYRKDGGHEEKSILLTNEEAQFYLQNGFNISILEIGDMDVKKRYELTTERSKTPYKSGTLFFDKSTYYGKTDYEVEYEINDDTSLDEGSKLFHEFLMSHNIMYVKTLGKTKRAYKEKSNQ